MQHIVKGEQRATAKKDIKDRFAECVMRKMLAGSSDLEWIQSALTVGIIESINM